MNDTDKFNPNEPEKLKIPEGFDSRQAHITHPDGTVFQVLNHDRTEWDEAETAKVMRAYCELNPGELYIRYKHKKYGTRYFRKPEQTRYIWLHGWTKDKTVPYEKTVFEKIALFLLGHVSKILSAVITGFIVAFLLYYFNIKK